jgi:hypothetical protein
MKNPDSELPGSSSELLMIRLAFLGLLGAASQTG